MSKSEVALRRMRQKIFDYDGTPKEAQAGRVLVYLKARVMRHNKENPYATVGGNQYAETM